MPSSFWNSILGWLTTSSHLFDPSLELDALPYDKYPRTSPLQSHRRSSSTSSLSSASSKFSSSSSSSSTSSSSTSTSTRATPTASRSSARSPRASHTSYAPVLLIPGGSSLMLFSPPPPSTRSTLPRKASSKHERSASSLSSFPASLSLSSATGSMARRTRYTADNVEDAGLGVKVG